MTAFWSFFGGSKTAEMSVQYTNTWSEEQDRILRELWGIKTLTAADIGKKMSPPRSKNGVIGRARRLGLPPKTNRASIRGDTTPRTVPRKSPRSVLKPYGIQIPLFPEPQDWSPIGVPLLEALRHHCRAIVESSTASVDGQVVYCGHPKVQGQPFSFCRHHLALYTTKHIRRR